MVSQSHQPLPRHPLTKMKLEELASFRKNFVGKAIAAATAASDHVFPRAQSDSDESRDTLSSMQTTNLGPVAPCNKRTSSLFHKPDDSKGPTKDNKHTFEPRSSKDGFETDFHRPPLSPASHLNALKRPQLMSPWIQNESLDSSEDDIVKLASGITTDSEDEADAAISSASHPGFRRNIESRPMKNHHYSALFPTSAKRVSDRSPSLNKSQSSSELVSPLMYQGIGLGVRNASGDRSRTRSNDLDSIDSSRNRRLEDASLRLIGVAGFNDDHVKPSKQPRSPTSLAEKQSKHKSTQALVSHHVRSLDSPSHSNAMQPSEKKLPPAGLHDEDCKTKNLNDLRQLISGDYFKYKSPRDAGSSSLRTRDWPETRKARLDKARNGLLAHNGSSPSKPFSLRQRSSSSNIRGAVDIENKNVLDAHIRQRSASESPSMGGANFALAASSPISHLRYESNPEPRMDTPESAPSKKADLDLVAQLALDLANDAEDTDDSSPLFSNAGLDRRLSHIKSIRNHLARTVGINHAYFEAIDKNLTSPDTNTEVKASVAEAMHGILALSTLKNPDDLSLADTSLENEDSEHLIEDVPPSAGHRDFLSPSASFLDSDDGASSVQSTPNGDGRFRNLIAALDPLIDGSFARERSLSHERTESHDSQSALHPEDTSASDALEQYSFPSIDCASREDDTDKSGRPKDDRDADVQSEGSKTDSNCHVVEENAQHYPNDESQSSEIYSFHGEPIQRASIYSAPHLENPWTSMVSGGLEKPTETPQETASPTDPVLPATAGSVEQHNDSEKLSREASYESRREAHDAIEGLPQGELLHNDTRNSEPETCKALILYTVLAMPAFEKEQKNDVPKIIELDSEDEGFPPTVDSTLSPLTSNGLESDEQPLSGKRTFVPNETNAAETHHKELTEAEQVEKASEVEPSVPSEKQALGDVKVLESNIGGCPTDDTAIYSEPTNPVSESISESNLTHSNDAQQDNVASNEDNPLNFETVRPKKGKASAGEETQNMDLRLRELERIASEHKELEPEGEVSKEVPSLLNKMDEDEDHALRMGEAPSVVAPSLDNGTQDETSAVAMPSASDHHVEETHASKTAVELSRSPTQSPDLVTESVDEATDDAPAPLEFDSTGSEKRACDNFIFKDDDNSRAESTSSFESTLHSSLSSPTRGNNTWTTSCVDESSQLKEVCEPMPSKEEHCGEHGNHFEDVLSNGASVDRPNLQNQQWWGTSIAEKQRVFSQMQEEEAENRFVDAFHQMQRERKDGPSAFVATGVDEHLVLPNMSVFQNENGEPDRTTFYVAWMTTLLAKHLPKGMYAPPTQHVRTKVSDWQYFFERMEKCAPRGSWDAVDAVWRWKSPYTGQMLCAFIVFWWFDLVLVLPFVLFLGSLVYTRVLGHRGDPEPHGKATDMIASMKAESFADYVNERTASASSVWLQDLGDLLEKVDSLYRFPKHPSTRAVCVRLSLISLGLCLVPSRVLYKGIVLYIGMEFFVLWALRDMFPQWRRALSPVWWILSDAPTHAEMAYNLQDDQSLWQQSGNEPGLLSVFALQEGMPGLLNIGKERASFSALAKHASLAPVQDAIALDSIANVEPYNVGYLQGLALELRDGTRRVYNHVGCREQIRAMMTTALK